MTGWNQGKEAPGNDLDGDVVAQFRVGNFEDAESEVKEAFVFTMRYLMPAINKEWQVDKGMQIVDRLSKKTTASDEALLIWMLRYGKDTVWKKLFQDKNNKKAKSGEHIGKKYGQEYVKILMTIGRARKTEAGKTWDDAMQAEYNKVQNARMANNQDGGGDGQEEGPEKTAKKRKTMGIFGMEDLGEFMGEEMQGALAKLTEPEDLETATATAV